MKGTDILCQISTLGIALGSPDTSDIIEKRPMKLASKICIAGHAFFSFVLRSQESVSTHSVAVQG